MDGASPLKPRKERFAQLLVTDNGLTQVEKYCRSVRPHLPVTKGRQVNASRMAKAPDVAARVAYLKKQKADRAQANAEPVTAENLTQLMHEITDVLVKGADAAERVGAQAVSTQLRRLVSTHIGRLQRSHSGGKGDVDPAPRFDLDGAHGRLKWCQCAPVG